MNVRYLFLSSILLVGSARCASAQSPPQAPMTDIKPTHIVEQPSAAAPPASGDFDLVVDEASVGRFADVTFTVSGLIPRTVDGATILTTYVDIERSRIVDLVEGTTFELKPGVRLKVVRITGGPGQKGRLWFKQVAAPPTP